MYIRDFCCAYMKFSEIIFFESVWAWVANVDWAIGHVH